MRRPLGALLVGLGALLVGIGLLAKPYLFPSLATVPLNQKSTSVSQGTDMSVLYPHVVDGKPAIDKLSGVKVVSTREVVGIPGVVKDLKVQDTDAFWQTTVKSQAEVDGQLVDLSFSNEGVSFNRVSGAATNCCGDFVSTGDLTDPTAQKDIKHDGLFFKFPFGVQKQSYLWWDGDLERANPIDFQGEETLFGTKVYVFKQTLGPEALAQGDGTTTISLPESLFASGKTGNVNAQEMYANTRTLWVEPVTGVLIKGQEEITKTYQAPGYEPLKKTVGTIGFDDATVQKNAEDWGAKAGLLGAMLVALGSWMVLRRNDETDPLDAALGEA